ncbi:hypothetical protein TorRG33x02_354320 [Trema orientale]|uniref:Uncharacterized protein n=1 Tax=Trema orientale TaxID=63057 RepID=A0A2P5ABJ2_TREOI|nr:hypothetical protein TorRG33x02_354320 [Trema orientale]
MKFSLNMESKFRRVIITHYHKVHLFPDVEPSFFKNRTTDPHYMPIFTYSIAPLIHITCLFSHTQIPTNDYRPALQAYFQTIKYMPLANLIYAFENGTIEIFHASFKSSNAHQWLISMMQAMIGPQVHITSLFSKANACQWLISMMQVITRPDIHHRANKQAPLNKRSRDLLSNPVIVSFI